MFVAAPVLESPPVPVVELCDVHTRAPVVEYAIPAPTVSRASPVITGTVALRQCRSPRGQSWTVVAFHRQGRRHPCRGAEADLPDVSEDDSDSVKSTSPVTENHNKNGYVNFTTFTRTSS